MDTPPQPHVRHPPEREGLVTQAHRFLYSRRMELEGFPDQQWYGGLAFRMLQDVPVQQLFDDFSGRVIESVSRKFLPVYRMADGEFEFISGKQPAGDGDSGPLHSLVHHARRVSRRIRFTTCWGETYSLWQRERALRILSASIGEIAQSGCLALYFAKRADGWGEEYFVPTCRWLEREGIELTPRNYVPFYLVYALLAGPAREALLASKRLLVVTHLPEERRSGIDRALRGMGAASVEFINIPATGAIFESLDVSRVAGSVDLGLIAAGIGSASVLCQLAPLSVPVIDAGMWIDCLLRPERRRERPFLEGA
jgi:hypothetical protein